MIEEKLAILNTSINNHSAVTELGKFGKNLNERPLDKQSMIVFFATLWAFFREVPTGILSLSLRVSDDWMDNYNEWEGTGRAAPILYANVDEFGIQSDKKLLPTHHQLFNKLMLALKVEQKDLLNPRNILNSGRTFGAVTREYYREKSIFNGIGFHLASEFTSSIEFQYFLDGFKKFSKEYGLNEETKSHLNFFHIHTKVEPLHLELGKLSAKNYLEVQPNALAEMEKGAIKFLDGFGGMFKELNEKLYMLETV